MEVDLMKDQNVSNNNQNNTTTTDTDLSNNSLEVTNKLEKSNPIEVLEEKNITIDKIEDKPDIITTTLSSLAKNPFVPTIVVSKFNNPNAHITKQNESLNLKEIPISKTANSNVKTSHLMFSNNITKKPITIISPSTIFRIQPKSNTVGANTIKPKQVKIISSLSKSKSGVYLVPHNGMNYFVKKFQSKPENDSSENYTSIASPSTIKSINNIEKLIEKDKTIIIKRNFPLSFGKRKIPNTTQVEKLPDGSFRMVQNDKDAPKSLIKFVGKTFTTNAVTKSIKPQINSVPSGTIKPQVLKTFQCINSNKVRFIQPRNNLPAPLTYKTSNFINTTKCMKIIPRPIIKQEQSNNQQINITSTKVTAYNVTNIIENSILKFVPVKEIKPKKVLQCSAQLKQIPTKIFENQKIDLKNASGTTTMSNKTIDKIPKILSNNTAAEKCENKTKEDFEDDDKSGCLVCCQYEYCEAIVLERELVDDMFCSVSCRNSAVGIPTTKLKKTSPPPTPSVSPPKKPKLDRSMILEKLRNTIRLKRSKLLQPEKTDSKDCLNKLDSLENSSKKSKLDIEHSKKLDAAIPSKSRMNTKKKVAEKKIESSSSTLPVVKNCPILPKCLQNEKSDQDEYLKSVEDGKKILNYVKIKEFRSAPKKLFKTPFPDKINNFKVNQKLEGIDPEHEALFCVMTIVEVCGFRIKLHFDGYPDEYDFWVNADCPNIFYANWCNDNSRTLEPPKDYKTPFNWSTYLIKCKATPVPKNILVSTVNTTFFQDHKFKIGDKLEALDKVTRTLPKQLICVATVADILGRRIRIHFDGWTDDFDYWTDISSTNLHPINWCDNNGRSLAPPYGYSDSKGRKRFRWDEYLKETNSQAVPENAFIRVPLRDFFIDMAIEIVDLVLPSLIRIAKVVNVKDNEIKILYDGFHPDYAYWVEDDNPDIHPIGWCFKTSHPLEIPSDTLWSCNIAGCNGIGNSNSSKLNHTSIKDCPYELETWKQIANGTLKLLDRLTPDNAPRLSMAAVSKNSKKKKNEPKIKRKKKIRKVKKKKIKEENIKIKEENIKIKEEDVKIKEEDVKIKEEETDELQENEIINEDEIKIELENSDVIKSSELSTPVKQINSTKLTVKLEIEDELKINRTCDIVREYKKKSTQESMAELGLKWARIQNLKGIPIFSTEDPRKWSVEEVANFADMVVRNQNIDNPVIVSDRLIAEEIDGECFLMLNKNDLLSILQIPLGPALKLTNVIKILQEKASIFHHMDSRIRC